MASVTETYDSRTGTTSGLSGAQSATRTVLATVASSVATTDNFGNHGQDYSATTCGPVALVSGDYSGAHPSGSDGPFRIGDVYPGLDVVVNNYRIAQRVTATTWLIEVLYGLSGLPTSGVAPLELAGVPGWEVSFQSTSLSTSLSHDFGAQLQDAQGRRTVNQDPQQIAIPLYEVFKAEAGPGGAQTTSNFFYKNASGVDVPLQKDPDGAVLPIPQTVNHPSLGMTLDRDLVNFQLQPTTLAATTSYLERLNHQTFIGAGQGEILFNDFGMRTASGSLPGQIPGDPLVHVTLKFIWNPDKHTPFTARHTFKLDNGAVHQVFEKLPPRPNQPATEPVKTDFYLNRYANMQGLLDIYQ